MPFYGKRWYTANPQKNKYELILRYVYKEKIKTRNQRLSFRSVTVLSANVGVNVRRARSQGIPGISDRGSPHRPGVTNIRGTPEISKNI
mmetsp:Transcript_5798/g.10950  ORF Transcript_5798/g.10950 Transcript_5798/m.10950 type:complete len:89 (+) Transcript_5798:63-329(+)